MSILGTHFDRTWRKFFGCMAMVATAGTLPPFDSPMAFAKTTGKRAGLHVGARTNAWAIDPKKFETFHAVLDRICQIGYTGVEVGFGNVIDPFTGSRKSRLQIDVAGLTSRDLRDGRQVVLGQGTFQLAEVAATRKGVGWHGWVLNAEERLDHSKHGANYMQPVFRAMRGAFSA